MLPFRVFVVLLYYSRVECRKRNVANLDDIENGRWFTDDFNSTDAIRVKTKVSDEFKAVLDSLNSLIALINSTWSNEDDFSKEVTLSTLSPPLLPKEEYDDDDDETTVISNTENSRDGDLPSNVDELNFLLRPTALQRTKRSILPPSAQHLIKRNRPTEFLLYQRLAPKYSKTPVSLQRMLKENRVKAESFSTGPIVQRIDFDLPSTLEENPVFLNNKDERIKRRNWKAPQQLKKGSGFLDTLSQAAMIALKLTSTILDLYENMAPYLQSSERQFKNQTA